ncbi:tyrosine-type recombinase/integrase [Novosphingobium humi]|uniref:tyrosine-type recombinase/integrase n=1 Tax=Novosphingobium humi TaxID=2282397 RepID=UPI0025B0B164|nr:integrase family protein [Novosphingobium humi]WJS98922.1 integrase family protein [Novosphingobium humi]
MVKLTKTFVDKVQPPAEGHEVHWDDAVKGYGLRVTSAGKKVFMVMGRVRGKALQWTIGPYGVMTEDQARKKAQSVLQQMRDGIDPREVKKADEAMRVTLSDVVKGYVARPGKLKERSKTTIERHLVTTFKAWADKPIASITEDMCRSRYKEMAEKGLHGKKGAPGQANQGFDILRALLNYAARQYKRGDGTPLIQRNPTLVLGDHKVKLQPRTSRYVAKDKVGDVWHALTTARNAARWETERTSYDLTMFLILTGARIDEAASLTWDNVHIVDAAEECRWHVTDRKRGADVWMPLSAQAVAVLKRRPKLADSPYVFASGTAKGYMDQPRASLAKVSEVAGQHLSAHDMRRTFTNIALGVCRIEKFRTDLLTGHKPKGDDVTASHYLDIANLSWLHPEAQAIGDWIEKQGMVAAAKAEGRNVVVLKVG